MSHFNFGHAALFWDEILYALETSEQLAETERSITLVSPWIRDLSLTTSNISSDEWTQIFQMPNRTFTNLSDVLIALSKIGFNITVLTLDSEDKALPKNNRDHLAKEERFVKKLTSATVDSDNPILVVKKFGIHNKMYCFPWTVLLGSANMTHRGMLGNSESLTAIQKERDPERFAECQVNAHALVDGAVDYGLGSLVRIEPLIIAESNHLTEEEQISNPPEIDLAHRQHEFQREEYPTPESLQEQGRLFSLGAAFPEHIEETEHFLNSAQTHTLLGELKAFENEFRQFILSYFKTYADAIMAWSEEEISLHENWHKLIYVSHRETFHEKAGRTVKQRKFRPSDIPGGLVPNWRDLSPDEAVYKGSSLGDLRAALVGIINDGLLPLTDPKGTDLAEKAVLKLTRDLRGRKDIRREDAQAFWSKYFGSIDTAYDEIQWVRNALSHHDDISAERAQSARYSMSTISRVVFEPWWAKHKGDTMP